MEPINLPERRFHQVLSDRLIFNKYYTDAVLLRHAFNFIPFEELKIKAALKLSLMEEKDEIDWGLGDFILLEVLHWYKNSFFTWINTPKCGSCNLPSVSIGSATPTEAESQSHAGTVELYQCESCKEEFRFPRYNHPKKLLQTRTGRCGEWANCFALLCSALEFNVRLVFDFNDHVWCEVFSESRDKWVHCDPCEEAYDTPLMYESGWKKEISHVMAVSPIEMQDVTWRYTTDFGAALRRRANCREDFILSWILVFQSQLERNLDPDGKLLLKLRRIGELAEFLTPPTLLVDSYEGRSSGSLAWKIARGEAGLRRGKYVFSLTPEEINNKRFLIKYSSAKDVYVRTTSHSSETPSWSSCIFSHENVFRKVEHDWKMAYLARSEGTGLGIVTWKFEFEKSDLVISELLLFLDSKTFEDGQVKWVVAPNCDSTKAIEYSSDHVKGLHTDDLTDCTSFLLSAELSEGSGSNAWQHAQLFRQSVDSPAYPFVVEILFKEKVC